MGPIDARPRPLFSSSRLFSEAFSVSDLIDPLDDDILEPMDGDDGVEQADDSDGVVDPLAEVIEDPIDDDGVESPLEEPVLASVVGAAAAEPSGPVATVPAAETVPVAENAKPLLSDGVDEASPRAGRFFWLAAAPAWLVSTLVHVAIILVLGLITFAEPVKIINVLTANPTGEEGPEIEEFVIEEIDPGEVAEMEEMVEPVEEMTEQLEMVEPAEVEPMELASIDVPVMDMASEMAPTMSKLQTLASATSAPMGGRSKDMKKKMLREYGGTESSEAAVTEALKWLSRHQLPNGAWTFQHNLVCGNSCNHPGEPERAKAVNAATAVALLPFMGAGQTHVSGDFRKNVGLGLRFLIQNGKAGNKRGLPVLDLSEAQGNMYSHGLATIALCEAYAMTEDPELLVPAQAAVNFIVYAQCADGGWRYRPQQADGGDTSVVGWQVMGLKSGHMGHLAIPQQTFQGASLFLDRVGSDGGAIYGYDRKSTVVRGTTTAIGLLCRMYSGWDRTHPGIVKGVQHLSKVGVNKQDLYYNYYAAQVLRQNGGEPWDKFNNELRDWLVDTQDQKSGAKGSWYFPDARPHSGPREGGRLLATAFSTMILEVYYRHMPLYADKATEDDFPL